MRERESEREEGALVLQEGCEFAEELLHKENVPHCLQGDGIARWSRVFFSPSYLVPKWLFHEDSWFWAGSLIYAGFSPDTKSRKR